MKKALCLLLSILMLLPTLYSCGDKENPASDFYYEENEDGGITITSYRGTDPDIIIPSKIEGAKVTVIGEWAFIEQTHIESVVIPNTVKTISLAAFYGCINLASVRLSDNLYSIESQAFRECHKLSEINLPSSLTEIGEAAFQSCTSLKSIRIPALKSIGTDVFRDSALETVEFDKELETIGNCMFFNTNLKNITIPSGVKEIEDSAFASCSELEKVTLNEGLSEISIGAFAFCPMLNELTIPSTVHTISEYAIASCENFKVLKFSGNAPLEFLCKDAVTISLYSSGMSEFTIYYHEGAEGFTSPEWNGYPTKTW